MVDLDKTEKMMIRHLQRDGRMSFVEMAKEIGVTEGTIRRKFSRLVEDNIIHIAAIADPFKVGFETPAFIGVRAETRELENVVRQISALPMVRYVAIATGEYDIIIEGYFTSNQELSDFVINQLGSISGIKDSTTSLLLSIAKQVFTWGVAEGK